jgi:hypothetical protein
MVLAAQPQVKDGAMVGVGDSEAAQVTIHASPEIVHELLSDPTRMPQWSPEVIRVVRSDSPLDRLQGDTLIDGRVADLIDHGARIAVLVDVRGAFGAEGVRGTAGECDGFGADHGSPARRHAYRGSSHHSHTRAQ